MLTNIPGCSYGTGFPASFKKNEEISKKKKKSKKECYVHDDVNMISGIIDAWIKKRVLQPNQNNVEKFDNTLLFVFLYCYPPVMEKAPVVPIVF